ncbi:MAG: OsmC family protein [Leptospira sp.]|nr:OsmC family protein [Leptospira sp.]
MEDVHLYETTVKWTRDRKGISSGPGLPDLEVATPPEFPKGHPGIWSPEHLFASAANVCLMTTFLAVAENSKFEFNTFECKAIAKLEKVDGKFMISEIELFPVISIRDEKDREKAEKIIHKSEAACLISNSMKSKIILSPMIKVD